MRQLKLRVSKVSRLGTEIEVNYLKDGEWHVLRDTFRIPTGPTALPEGATTLVFPDEWDRQDV